MHIYLRLYPKAEATKTPRLRRSILKDRLNDDARFHGSSPFIEPPTYTETPMLCRLPLKSNAICNTKENIICIEFEWDNVNNSHNIAKPGLGFADAVGKFNDFTLDARDDRFDYGEERNISIGQLTCVVILTVIHADRDGVFHIISALPAKRSERKWNDEAIRDAFDT